MELIDALRPWPWEVIISTGGAIVVAWMARGNTVKNKELVDALDGEVTKFREALDVADEHFKTQSELLQQSIQILAARERPSSDTDG